MAEHIEREALRKAILVGKDYLDDDTLHTVINILDCAHAADVAPVVHGRWEKVIPSKSAAKWSTAVSCSECHMKGYTRYSYCPNCGAKMDSKGGHNAD